VLGSRADILRRRPAARRRRISHSAQALPIATCTRAAARSACTQAALVLGSRADVLRRRPAARSSPAASPPRPVHHADSCCCSRCLRAAAPCPPPCRALPRTVLTTPRPSHPQPSARNRPGERMRLLDGNTYRRPDAEVLPLITPAAARARDGVRRISHATRSGQRRPVAKRSTGRGQGKGRRGRRRRGRTTPHIRHRSRAPRKHPVPHIRPTHVVAHPPLIAAVFHAQTGWTPLHFAAACSSSVAVVQALLAANPEAASATDNVRRPPLAAWMRGPERSSEVIICNQGQSGVIIRNQRALSGTQRALSGTQSHSVATRWAPQRPSAGPSEAIRGTQWLIRGDQRYSEALRGHQRPLRATQRHSVAFSGTQRRSEGPRHAVFTAPRPA
jgi:ankyrin repeat protein